MGIFFAASLASMATAARAWNPSALTAEPPPIPSHAVAAVCAVLIGICQLAGPKGTRVRKIVGYAWVALMIYVAVSSFLIHELEVFGPFSPIHLVSIFAIGAVAHALLAVRRGRVAAHGRTMKWLFWVGLVATGLLTLLPGRAMHSVAFG